jgi:GNAT superfamily N-acetyltransferase
MLNDYPKEAILRDGTVAVLRPLSEDDTAELYKFFSSLSKKARTFLYDDVIDRTVVERWVKNINYSLVLPILALIDNQIVADATLHKRNFGPLRHIGRIRIVVRDDYRGKGIGTILTNELTYIAKESNLKVLSCMLAEKGEKEAIEAMEALGFERVAVIPKYAMDVDGNIENVMMMMKSL